MLSPFVKLADPSTYIACTWDLCVDSSGRTHWVEFFKRHIHTILNLGIEAGRARGVSLDDLNQRAGECVREFVEQFDHFAAAPETFEHVTILTLDEWRDALLRKYGFGDAFVDLKDRENRVAVAMLPAVIQQLDSISDPAEQLRAAIEGVFAGNIFDMGSEATAKKFLHESPDLAAVRKSLPPRPWRIDDFDALSKRLLADVAYRKAIVFIDNAGSDFVLGIVPLVRWLARRGTRVILAANERPTLNDMTIHDVKQWWPQIVEKDPLLATLPIDRVSTGTGEPLIDLARVSSDLNKESVDADLVIIEGMGRAVESNLDARLNCDVLKIAMIKDDAVAGRVGGKIFDVICKFEHA